MNRAVGFVKRAWKPGLAVAVGLALTVVAIGAARAAGTQGSMPAAHLMTMKKMGSHMHVKNWMLQPTGIAGVTPLDPTTIPKFVNQLPKPPTFVATSKKGNAPLYEVFYTATKEQILPPGFPSTPSFAYGGVLNFANPGQPPDIRVDFTVPGPTFEATRNQDIFVHYHNAIFVPELFPVDPTIMVANQNNQPMPTAPFQPFPPGYPKYQFPVPVVTHLHGAIVQSDSDGFPFAWFTFGELEKGPAFSSSLFHYINQQPGTTLWYHDHTIGETRIHVAAGLVGTYIIRDPNDPIAPLLPSGKYEMPLVLLDRAFNSDGSIHFTQVGDNPDSHPYWDPEYFGDTITVNGKVWPNLKVDRHQYYFRIVDGSNARFYDLSLSNGMTFTQIGGDGSYLPSAVEVSHALIAPSQRMNILIDFSNVPAGTKIILQNSANAPYPGGDPADPNTTGVVMQFEVRNTPAVHPPALPSTLMDIPTLVATDGIGNPKLFTLNEEEDPISGDPLGVFIDGRHFDADVTEVPKVGTTEEWYIQNLTEDAHPIHVHLVEFQLEDRQDIDVDRFTTYWQSLNGTTLPLDHPVVRANVEDAVFDPATGTVHDFLTGPVEPPEPREQGWKDTIIAFPHQVMRFLIRFAPLDTPESALVPGFNPFPFDSTTGPGYVWHCHILDHEDNDMMRPMKMTPP